MKKLILFALIALTSCTMSKAPQRVYKFKVLYKDGTIKIFDYKGSEGDTFKLSDGSIKVYSAGYSGYGKVSKSVSRFEILNTQSDAIEIYQTWRACDEK